MFVLAFAALLVLGGIAAIQMYLVFFSRDPSRKRWEGGGGGHAYWGAGARRGGETVGLFLMIMGGLLILCGYVLDVHIKAPSGPSVFEQRVKALEQDLDQLRASVVIRK
jgi:hypothetical protein